MSITSNGYPGNRFEIAFRQLSKYSMTNGIEDKAVLINNLREIYVTRQMVLKDFIALLFCTEGRLELDMDGSLHTLNKGDVLFCPKGACLHDVMQSLSFKGKALCVAWGYAQTLFMRSTCQWDSILQLRHYPLLHPQGCEQELFYAYYHLFLAKVDCQSYAADIDYIFQGFFYDLYRVIDRHVLREPQQRKYRMLRQEKLCKQFLALLKEECCREHSCTYYADRLCVTPKYLTTVVKQVSGKSVSKWIDCYLLEQIKFLLKTTNLAASEIADKLNFSNASFFGRYVKKHTGEPPLKLRLTLQAARS